MRKHLAYSFCILFSLIFVSCSYNEPPQDYIQEIYEGENLIVYFNNNEINYVDSAIITKYQYSNYRLTINNLFHEGSSTTISNIFIENDKFSTTCSTNHLYDETTKLPDYSYFTTLGIEGEFTAKKNDKSEQKKLILHIYIKKQEPVLM